MQSKTTEKKLEQNKFGVKDKLGKVKVEFVTIMEASHRAKGVNMPKQPIIKTKHGEDFEFLMVLHINDTVSIEKDNGLKVFYRVQKIGGGYDVTLRLNTASTISITQPLVIECQKNNIIIILCDEKHLPYFTILLISERNNLHQKILKQQINITEPVRKNLWKQVIQQKITHQANTLKQFDKPFMCL